MKKIILILAVFIIIVSAVLDTALKNQSNKGISKKIHSNEKNESNFLLEGFPKQVPLYKLTKVSSNKIFINTDPKNSSAFGQNNFAYYNVVFYSNSSKEEFLNYYKSIFEKEIIEEFQSPDMVKGIIGQYKVTAAHYGSEDNSGYLQVYLPSHNDKSIGQYFSLFPEILKVNSTSIEHEKSYGLLNQKGGEVEFTKYFTVIDSGDADKDGKDDIDEFVLLETEYQTLYGQKPRYSYNKENKTMEWKEGDFEVTLVLSRAHGRIYLMIRKPFNKKG